MTTFIVFLIGYTLSQFYRSFLAVIAPELARELSLSPADLAGISAAWFLTFSFAQFVVGVALDRIGPRRTVPTLMLVAVLGAVLLSQARTPAAATIANGLIGLGCSPIYMGALYVFARTAAPARFGFLTAWLLGLGSAGNLLSATPLSLAAATLGWRSSFLAIAGLTLIAAVIIAVVVRDPPRAERPAGSGSMVRELAQILNLRPLWRLVPMLCLGYGVVISERALWIGPYLSDVQGLEGLARGNAILAMAAALCLGALVYGVLDRAFAGRQWTVVVAGSLLTAGCFMTLGAVPSLSLGPAVALLALAGLAGLSNPIVVAEARKLFPAHLLGRGLTTVNFLTIGGAGALQWLSGAVMASAVAQGVAPAEAFAALHLSFGGLLVIVTVIYLLPRRTA